jgi:hypothetical protein
VGYRKSAGRPKNTDGKDIVTLDEAIRRAQEHLGLPKPPFSRRTLQNKITACQYERYGTYHEPMVDWDEVKRSLQWRRKKSA